MARKALISIPSDPHKKQTIYKEVGEGIYCISILPFEEVILIQEDHVFVYVFQGGYNHMYYV